MNADQIAHALKNVTLIFLAGRPGAGKEKTGDQAVVNLPKSVRIVTSDEVDRSIAGLPEDSADRKTMVAYKQGGKMVPDKYVIPIVFARIADLYTEGYTRIILDGFPRTDEQDEKVTRIASKYLMCYLDIDVNLAVERMLGRGRTGETRDKCLDRQRVFEECTLPMVERFAVLHPLNYLEIDSGKFEPEDRARILTERVLALETALSPIS